MFAKAALTINAAIGVSFALFYFNMLPFAEGVACEARHRAAILCDEPTGVLLRGGMAVAILIFVLAISIPGYRCRIRRPRLSTALLCVVPVLLLVWIGAVIVQ